MSRKLYLSLCLCIALQSIIHAQHNSRQNFGSDWEFRRETSPESSWESISLPHTTRIEPLVVNDQFQGNSWYRKNFTAPETQDSKVFLYFEGVMQTAEIWINNQMVKTHLGGYLPFSIDIAPHIRQKEKNSILIRVNNEDNPEVPPGKPLKDLDFNYYGGIYRNVYLYTTGAQYITDPMYSDTTAGGGMYIHFSGISLTAADGSASIEVRNDATEEADVTLHLDLLTPNNKKTRIGSRSVRMKGSSVENITFDFKVTNPKLWELSDPQLYTVVATLTAGGKPAGAYSQRVGIRLSEIRPDGYYLNGRKLYVPGTNRHQEYPYVGYAISDEAQYRDAVKIKNAGFDFVRLSHYPQAETFLNACDELGILVMNSIPGWQFFGGEKFQQNALQDVRKMARRDRNHASVAFWEVSLNESSMDEAFMKKATETLKKELPKGNNITVGWMDSDYYDLFIPARQHAKAPDYWNHYDKGNRKIFIAEYGDWEYYAQNAGFNQKEFANLKEEERTSRQLRAFGEKRLLQQAYNFQEASNSNRKGKHTIGEANWLMFDYNRGYAPDIESSGISDIFRIPKFAYYFYQSQRHPDVKLPARLESGPMVRIASYWDEHSSTELRIFSNCDEVELTLNGQKIAKQKPHTDHNSDMLPHPPFVFNMGQFVPGTLTADGYIKGKKVASHTVKTPGKPSRIKLTYDLSNIPINKTQPDIVFVYAEITDNNGTIVPHATNNISFKLTGENAVLTGQNPQPAEAGISTILLRSESRKGKLTITATAEGLQDAIMIIE